MPDNKNVIVVCFLCFSVSIMINVGGKLVAPNLMAGQDLNAIALKEVTKSAKYIYLIPSMTIGHTGIVDDDPVSRTDIARQDDRPLHFFIQSFY